MKIAVVSFTNNGGLLNGTINELLSSNNYKCTSFTNSKFSKQFGFNTIGESIYTWTRNIFSLYDAFIFIGACGIAVRAIAPCIKSKAKDPAVIVIDEKGSYVIPILSGHLGGANKISIKISELLSAIPIITTATDVNNRFAVDIFSKKNNLYIYDIKMIKHISSAILADKKIGLYCEKEVKGNVPNQIIRSSLYDNGICIDISRKKVFKNTINLIPKVVTVGIGCKRNTEMSVIEKLLIKVLNDNNIDIHSIKNIASIDIKKNEKGIIELSNKYNLPFVTYSPARLMKLDGKFTESSFVYKTVGVDNVCERSAVMGSNKGSLIIKKTAKDGVAIALCEEEWSVDFE